MPDGVAAAALRPPQSERAVILTAAFSRTTPREPQRPPAEERNHLPLLFGLLAPVYVRPLDVCLPACLPARGNNNPETLEDEPSLRCLARPPGLAAGGLACASGSARAGRATGVAAKEASTTRRFENSGSRLSNSNFNRISKFQITEF